MAAQAATWCGWCGEETRSTSAHTPESVVCEKCRPASSLNPPRYCTSCRRRMKVQVLPLGWSASCVEHGVIGGDPGDSASREEWKQSARHQPSTVDEVVARLDQGAV